MPTCPSCDYPLPEDRERAGARCPNCRDPLYEPPGRFGRPVREGEGACTVHPTCESVGPCGRCGNFMCETCRTRWQNQVLCAACVERALTTSAEAAPEQSRTDRRQASMAVRLGVGAWVAILLAALVAGLAGLFKGSDGEVHPTAAALTALVMMAALPGSLVMALFAVGQGVAVLRARGDQMIRATIGLASAAAYIGLFVGGLAAVFAAILSMDR